MDDLIDLTSSTETKIGGELPAPLIPSPTTDSPKLSNLLSTQRKSIDNNPFDMVLRKTSEYISKSSDPFEIVFEKATKLSPKINDEFFQKKKRHSDILKMNKTLDESLINTSQQNELLKTPKNIKKMKKLHDNNLPSISIEPSTPTQELSILNQSAMNDSFQILSPSPEILKKLPSITITPTKSDKSILNNSAMNDTLSTSENSSDDCCFIKSIIAKRVSMCIKQGTIDAEFLDADDINRNHKLRRSFSQGDRISPKKIKIKRSVSIINDKKNSLLSQDSVASILFEDPLNRAFMPREISNYSNTTDYSELSAITRLNSVNSMSLYSGKFSNETANRGFIDSSQLSDRSKGSDANFKDLIDRFKHLRMKSEREIDESINEKISGGNESDSVFIENDKNSAIFSQANLLAKTFEELAEHSTTKGSSSSDENLLSSHPPSNLELSSETSVPSMNLIDLPISPMKSQTNENTSTNPNDSEKKSQTIENEEINKIIQLEGEFLDPEKEIATTNLLLDLEKFVKKENNPVAMEILGSLEKALGFKRENNTKLLTLFCEKSKIDDKSPEKIENKNSKEIESNSPKINNEELCEKIEINENKDKSSETQDDEVTEKSSEDNTQDMKNSETDENPNIDKPTCKASKSITSTTESSENAFTTQKLILDLQLALGKLLEGCKGEPSLLLENLNKVLSPKPEEITKQHHNDSISPKKCSLPYRPIKSSTKNVQDTQKIVQKSTTKPIQFRRRSSITQGSCEKSKNQESTKRPDSPKKDAKRRNSSDPGFNIKNSKKQVDTNLKIKPTLPVLDKTKLKKKIDIGAKRGPMKAMVPLDNMQRSAKSTATPPKKEKIPPPLKFASSTPDPSPIIFGKKTTKAKPVASSTPDIGEKSFKRRSHIPQSPKHNMSWNISPVTPNAKSNGSDTFGKSPRKIDKSLDKAIKPSSPLVGNFKKSGDKIIHGRRSEPVQVSPKIEIKGAKASPLKEKNAIKVKPINLNAKFRGRSGSLGSTEKENKF